METNAGTAALGTLADASVSKKLLKYKGAMTLDRSVPIMNAITASKYSHFMGRMDIQYSLRTSETVAWGSSFLYGGIKTS
jgi:hypothetical protein